MAQREPPLIPAEEERELVERARSGSEIAFARLYDAYFTRLYRYILVRTGNEADAEDITEEVFLKVLNALPGFHWREAPFSAWVFRIAYNAVVDYHRRNGTRGQQVELPFARTVKDPGPEETVERMLTADEIRRAAVHLTEAQRQVLQLRFAAGLSLVETAKVLGKSVGNVKATQHHALARLKKLIQNGHQGFLRK